MGENRKKIAAPPQKKVLCEWPPAPPQWTSIAFQTYEREGGGEKFDCQIYSSFMYSFWKKMPSRNSAQRCAFHLLLWYNGGTLI